MISSHSNVISLFEEQVSFFPTNIALISEERTLNYLELNKLANQFAHHLKHQGVGNGTRVAVLLPRSIEMIITILGILKAGGVYVPIATYNPEERNQHILMSSRVEIIICNIKINKNLYFLLKDYKTIIIEECLEKFIGQNDENLSNTIASDDPLYIMHTSGSTGNAKGVIINHKSVLNLVKNQNYVSITNTDTFLQLSPYEFDGAIFEIWGALLNGAKLVLMPPGMPSLNIIAEKIQNFQVSIMFITTQLFNSLVDHRLKDLVKVKQILFGGETASVIHVKKFLKACDGANILRNIYGLTECTVFSISYLIPLEEEKFFEFIPIGKPILNTNVYVLDEQMNQVEKNTTGELYIGGLGLARNVISNNNGMEQSFLSNFFSNKEEKLYKTGDIVQIMDDGNLKFIGRRDNQIKIRGFRVNLEEIELVIRQHQSVEDVVIIYNKEAKVMERLVAYVIPKIIEHFNLIRFKRDLSKFLVTYMMPNQIIILKKFPLTLSGKIDRLNLQVYKNVNKNYIDDKSQFLEKIICDIWQEELEITDVNLDDNFFDLGGSSLLAINVLDRLQQHPINNFRALKITDMFEYPTIRLLADYVLSFSKNDCISISK